MIYFRNAQTVTNRGVGRRPTSLTQDATRASEAHNVIYRKKIPFILKVVNNIELLLYLFCHGLRNALWVTLLGTPPGFLVKIALCRQGCGNNFIGIFITQFA